MSSSPHLNINVCVADNAVPPAELETNMFTNYGKSVSKWERERVCVNECIRRALVFLSRISAIAYRIRVLEWEWVWLRDWEAVGDSVHGSLQGQFMYTTLYQAQKIYAHTIPTTHTPSQSLIDSLLSLTHSPAAFSLCCWLCSRTIFELFCCFLALRSWRTAQFYWCSCKVCVCVIVQNT